ncbi:MAG TPA: hypothetical protein PKY77_05445 [Phycisphaerae bacterium]|nr:hypothetical protein [Phycisphaerae bacterium]HRY68958.1 hypothetical protein [Phycisphaerae bacterium]HSA25785.1 hypothetical protein [Phycisphaerae bacterium]
MRKVSLLLSAFCVLTSLPVSASTLHWDGLGTGLGGAHNTPPTSGVGYGLPYFYRWSAEIVFDQVTGVPGYAGGPLVTFCLEYDEPLYGENNFNAAISSAAVKGGLSGQTLPDYDPLSEESAWIYDQYAAGNTFGISDANQRAAAAQEAIWSFEGELVNPFQYAGTSGIKAAAGTAVLGGWKNTTISVLNLTWASTGQDGQDVLIQIPEPMSLTLLALGAIVAHRRRRA